MTWKSQLAHAFKNLHEKKVRRFMNLAQEIKRDPETVIKPIIVYHKELKFGENVSRHKTVRVTLPRPSRICLINYDIVLLFLYLHFIFT
jgi:hypothetical protein